MACPRPPCRKYAFGEPGEDKPSPLPYMASLTLEEYVNASMISFIFSVCGLFACPLSSGTLAFLKQSCEYCSKAYHAIALVCNLVFVYIVTMRYLGVNDFNKFMQPVFMLYHKFVQARSELLAVRDNWCVQERGRACNDKQRTIRIVRT
jgi:hypothetical protein